MKAQATGASFHLEKKSPLSHIRMRDGEGSLGNRVPPSARATPTRPSGRFANLIARDPRPRKSPWETHVTWGTVVVRRVGTVTKIDEKQWIDWSCCPRCPDFLLLILVLLFLLIPLLQTKS